MLRHGQMEHHIEDQEKLAKHVTKQVEILQTVAGGSQSGCIYE